MKIALLTEKYTPDIGGLAISSERFARSLSSAGCAEAVRVFAPTLSLPPSEKRTLPSNGVSVTRFGANKRVDDTLVDWFELIVKEHAREPFDLLHAYFLTQAGFVATYAGKYLNIPSVVSIRGNDIERAPFDPSKFSHVMYALQNASAVTTNATELVKKAKAFSEGREIHLIPNGIDTECFRPMDKNRTLAELLGLTRNVILSEATLAPGASAGEDLERSRRNSSPSPKAQSDRMPVIGFVGELRKKKGIETLLSAYTQVNKQHPTTLLIVGEVRQGDDKKVLEEFQLSNPDSKVIITGHIPHSDLPSYYSLMDIFVHPSLRDGMPNAVLEAMACEKAVIATSVGGTKDILEDGKNGIIVNVNDAGMLAERILQLLDDHEKRKSLGKNARELVMSRFTPEKELEANLDIYRKIGLKL
jgi:glycosyltransferase involved in cell wall biosynthesis